MYVLQACLAYLVLTVYLGRKVDRAGREFLASLVREDAQGTREIEVFLEDQAMMDDPALLAYRARRANQVTVVEIANISSDVLQC